ncbi:MAG: IS6 family transposase, partial [Methanocellales archaeon]|nr:IS6 family transposase [Methanocellales archaeon]
MGIMLRHVMECLEDRNIFLRRRKSSDIKALAILLYYAGLSYRRTRDVLLGYEEVSHEAIRKWYIRCRSVTEVERRKRRTVAIDE